MTESTLAKPGRLWILVALFALLAGVNALRNELVYDGLVLVKSSATLDAAAAEESLPAKIVGLNALFLEGFWDGVNQKVDAALQVLGQALYRPLMLWTIGLIKVTIGDGATAYNVVNLLFHVLSSILVFSLAFRLTRRRAVAVIGGLLFAVHPLHAEAIAYVAGIGETQSVFLGLLSLVLYLGAATDSVFKPGRLAMAILAFALAIFTKEGAATILVLMILADLVRPDAPPMSRRMVMIGACGALIAVNVWIRWELFGRLSPDPTFITRLDNPLIHEGFIARLATGAMLYARSLQLFLVPFGQSADYSFNQLPIATSLFDPAALVALVLVGVMTVFGFSSLKRAPALGFGLLAFLFTFGATSNILVPIGTIFGERLLYLPSVGLSIAAAVLIDRLMQRAAAKGGSAPGIIRGLSVAVLIGFLMLTWMRNTKYKNADTLYVDMVATAPDSARAHYQRGELARKHAYQGSRESLSAAAYDFKQAMEIMPEFMLARLQYGSVLAESGQFKEGMVVLRDSESMIPDGNMWDPLRSEVKRRIATVLARASGTENPAERDQAIHELLTMMEEHVTSNPNDIGSVVELGVMYLSVGKFDLAEQLVSRELLSHPDDHGVLALAIQLEFKLGNLEVGKERIDAWDARGISENVDAQRAVDLYRGLYHLSVAMQQRDTGNSEAAMAGFDLAYAEFDRIVQLYPDFDLGWYNRAFVAHEAWADRWQEALADYQQVVRLNPANPDVFFRLSQLLVGQKKFNAVTLRLFQELFQVHQDNGFFCIGYGRVAGGVGAHDEAERAFTRAIELGFDGAQVHCALAMARLQLGREGDALTGLKEAERQFSLIDPAMIRMKGICHLEGKRYTNAVSQFDTAMRVIEQDPSGQYSGMVPQLQFDIAKTRLRVTGQESDGRRELGELRTTLDRMVASYAGDGSAPKIAHQLLCYVDVQLAWALTNVESMKDLEAAAVLLERARALAEKEVLEEVRADVLDALHPVYVDLGRDDDAAAVKVILDDTGPQLPAGIQGGAPPQGQ